MARTAAVALAAGFVGFVPMAADAADQWTCFGQPATIVGTEGVDTLHGTSGPDVIVGLGGDDVITGEDGDDLLCGSDDTGAGEQSGGTTGDLMSGGSGDDKMLGAELAGTVPGGWASGGEGDDTFDTTGVTYEDAPAGVVVDLDAGTATGWGSDTLHAVISLRGSPYDDVLLGNRNVPYEGECGCDYIEGLGGDDLLRGRRGWDRLGGDAGADTLVGNAGGDTLTPGGGPDQVRAGPGGSDTVSYFSERSAVTVDLAAGTASGRGRDTLHGVERAIGTRFADDMSGDGGPNALSGAAGADVIHGRAGADVLFGGEGRDRVYGGSGADEAVGGPNVDVCHAEAQSGCERPSASQPLAARVRAAYSA